MYFYQIDRLLTTLLRPRSIDLENICINIALPFPSLPFPHLPISPPPSSIPLLNFKINVFIDK